jgi:hypothetical protein
MTSAASATPAAALAYFTSASAQVQASVATRFGDERRDALAMLGR